MAGIVYVDPMYEESETNNRENTLPITSAVTFGDDHDHEHVVEPFDSEKLPATLASEIQKFLRVANLIERDEPRIAYLCRFHAFEIASIIDPNSTGQGVGQFISSLLRRLRQDEETSIRRRKEKSDIHELKCVYHTYKEYIIKHGEEFDLENSHRKKLINACKIASVVYEILKKKRNIDGAQLKLKKGRKRGGGKVGGTAKLWQQINYLIEEIESKNTPQSTAEILGCSIPEVIQLLNVIVVKLSQQINCLIKTIESKNTPQSSTADICSTSEVMQVLKFIDAKLGDPKWSPH